MWHLMTIKITVIQINTWNDQKRNLKLLNNDPILNIHKESAKDCLDWYITNPQRKITEGNINERTGVFHFMDYQCMIPFRRY